jgi:hypothetical protein
MPYIMVWNSRLAAGQPAVEGRFLEDDADAPAHGVAVAGDVEAGHGGAPAVGRRSVESMLMVVVLPPRWGEQAISPFDGERDVVHGREAVERLSPARPRGWRPGDSPSGLHHSTFREAASGIAGSIDIDRPPR